MAGRAAYEVSVACLVKIEIRLWACLVGYWGVLEEFWQRFGLQKKPDLTAELVLVPITFFTFEKLILGIK